VSFSSAPTQAFRPPDQPRWVAQRRRLRVRSPDSAQRMATVSHPRPGVPAGACAQEAAGTIWRDHRLGGPRRSIIRKLGSEIPTRPRRRGTTPINHGASTPPRIREREPRTEDENELPRENGGLLRPGIWLIDFAQKQPVVVDSRILQCLGIDHDAAIYFLALYLQSGYSVPRERYKALELKRS